MRVKFDDSGRLILLLFEKVSPPLLVIAVGNDMFALIGRITGCWCGYRCVVKDLDLNAGST